MSPGGRISGAFGSLKRVAALRRFMEKLTLRPDAVNSDDL
jgi:hypothetical protein